MLVSNMGLPFLKTLISNQKQCHVFLAYAKYCITAKAWTVAPLDEIELHLADDQFFVLPTEVRGHLDQMVKDDIMTTSGEQYTVNTEWQEVNLRQQ